MFQPLRVGVILGTLWMLAACNSVEPLSDATAESNFDLSGRWKLVEFESDLTPDTRRIMNEAERAVFSGGGRAAIRRFRDNAQFAFIAQDFPILKADGLEIEQNADSMGIVHQPGGYRDVTWGKRDRGAWKVRAGWNEDGALVVISKAGDLTGREQFTLRDSGLLFIEVSVRGGTRDLDLLRVYERTGSLD